MLEYPVPVNVEGHRCAAALKQALHQEEVIAGVLLSAEEGIDHGPGRVVHSDQEHELWSVAAQPPVIAAVHLDRHTLAGHALSAHGVLRWTPFPRVAQAGVQQDAPQGAPANVDTLTFTEQLAQVSVVGSRLAGTGQMQCLRLGRPRRCVGNGAAAMTVGEGGGAVRPVSRQNAPGMAGAHSHQCCRLIQCHMFRQQAVQNLKPSLFFCRQSHILHGVNVTLTAC